MGDVCYVIGIDPGSNTGVAIFELNSATLDMVNISTDVMLLNQAVTGQCDVMLERTNYLNRICDHLHHAYHPVAIGVEAAFLNSRFPKAVMQLSQYTSIVHQTFYNNNNFIKSFSYPPKYVKKHIGASGNADKDKMLTTVKTIPEISKMVNLDAITEHEIDALAIGYITIQHLRMYPHILISY